MCLGVTRGRDPSLYAPESFSKLLFTARAEAQDSEELTRYVQSIESPLKGASIISSLKSAVTYWPEAENHLAANG